MSDEIRTMNYKALNMIEQMSAEIERLRQLLKEKNLCVNCGHGLPCRGSECGGDDEIHMANCMACGAPNTQECDEECGRMVCRDATICEWDCSTTCGVCLEEEVSDEPSGCPKCGSTKRYALTESGYWLCHGNNNRCAHQYAMEEE